MVKNLHANAGPQETWVEPWVGKMPWREDMATSSPVLLPEEPRGQRSLVGYSPWGRKESDTTKATEHGREGKI